MSWVGSLLKLPFVLGKKAVGAVIPRNENVPIVAVGRVTGYPDAYRDYYETLGFTTDMYKGRVIVWDKGVSDKKKAKVLEELQKVV